MFANILLTKPSVSVEEDQTGTTTRRHESLGSQPNTLDSRCNAKRKPCVCPHIKHVFIVLEIRIDLKLRSAMKTGKPSQ